jgi:hypothetical protein
MLKLETKTEMTMKTETITKTIETKTIETKTIETKTIENKTIETKTIESKTIESKTIENKTTPMTFETPMPNIEPITQEYETGGCSVSGAVSCADYLTRDEKYKVPRY